LRSFQQNLEKFTSRGVRIVAVSVDPPEVTRAHIEKVGYTYTFLSDPSAEVIRRYDLLHPGGGIRGGDIARPAEFLLDRGGTVRWVNLSESYKVRVHAEEVLKALDDLGATPREQKK
jgi:peroxiredoxin